MFYFVLTSQTLFAVFVLLLVWFPQPVITTTSWLLLRKTIVVSDCTLVELRRNLVFNSLSSERYSESLFKFPGKSSIPVDIEEFPFFIKFSGVFINSKNSTKRKSNRKFSCDEIFLLHDGHDGRL